MSRRSVHAAPRPQGTQRADSRGAATEGLCSPLHCSDSSARNSVEQVQTRGQSPSDAPAQAAALRCHSPRFCPRYRGVPPVSVPGTAEQRWPTPDRMLTRRPLVTENSCSRRMNCRRSSASGAGVRGEGRQGAGRAPAGAPGRALGGTTWCTLLAGGGACTNVACMATWHGRCCTPGEKSDTASSPLCTSATHPSTRSSLGVLGREGGWGIVRAHAVPRPSCTARHGRHGGGSGCRLAHAPL